MTEKKPKDTIIKKLNIKSNHKDIKEFYYLNKSLIYEKVFDLFKSLKRNDKNNVVLVISSKINELHWESELKFNRNQKDILINELIPYFESLEEYEICGEIHSLHQKIKIIED